MKKQLVATTRYLAFGRKILGLLVAGIVYATPAMSQQGGVTLRGFIFDSATAEPIGTATLELDGEVLSTSTGMDGAFAITDVATGTHTLMVYGRGFTPKAFGFQIQPGGPETIDIGVLALVKIAIRDVTVYGTVSDASTNAAIEGVRITINDTVIAVTDFVGDFAVRRRVAEGVNRLTVQRIGYQTLVQEFQLEPLSTDLNLVVSLQPQATRLETVIVEADPAELNRKLEGFYERRQTEIGQFLGPDQIANIPASRTSDILRRMSSLSVRPLPGRTEIMINRCLRHLPRIYVDGLEVFNADVDLMLNALDVAAVEVYTGGAQIPIQFNRPAPGKCGVVLIWTK